jgi:hypothetical protein
MVGLALDQPIGRGTPPFLPARAKATSLTFIKMRQNAYYLRVIIAVGVHSDGRTSLTAGAQSCPRSSGLLDNAEIGVLVHNNPSDGCQLPTVCCPTQKRFLELIQVGIWRRIFFGERPMPQRFWGD